MDQPEALRPQTGIEGSSSESGSLGKIFPRPPLTVPTVPDYDLLRRIGGGAYGDVWLARSKATGAYRAAKIVWRHTFEDERPYRREFDGIQRFEKISREHPGQLALYHIGRNNADGYFYYVMELADNLGTETDYSPHTLRADLEKGRLPAARVLEISLALTEALGHLHAKGLIHRDVKPSNVIFVNGRPKLADIGLVADATDSRSIVGTEGYLPPEGPGTPQADIFALGKTLYEAVTGLDRRDFPKLPEDLCSWADAKLVFELNEIVLKACTADPRQRYANAEILLDELNLLRGGKSVQVRRAWNRRLLVARKTGIAATAAVLTAAGLLFLWQTFGTLRNPVPPNDDGTPGTRNATATAEYRLGLPPLRRGGPEGYRSAVDHFRAATNADPKFVAALARLFETQLLQEDRGLQPATNYSRTLNEMASQLKQLAPDSAETHAATAIVLFVSEWRWEQAEREFKRALSIDPRCRMALKYYGYFLVLTRRSAQARTVLERAFMERAFKLEVLEVPSADILVLLGHCEYGERHFEEAQWFYLRAAAIEPNYPPAFYWTGRAYLALSNYSKGLEQLELHTLKLGCDITSTMTRYQSFHDAVTSNGAPAYWTALINEQKTNELNGAASAPYLTAGRYARLNEKQRALESLQQAYDNHDLFMENVLLDEFWDPYSDDPHFQDILKKIGLGSVPPAPAPSQDPDFDKLLKKLGLTPHM